MRLLICALLLGVVSAPSAPTYLFAQAQKPDAALTPVAVLGNVSEQEKRIIFIRVQSELSAHYRLVSQDDYAAAEEQAFKELDAEKCTEEQCIRKIQDILQVDRLFSLQIIREGAFTQLSLTLVRASDKLVQDDTCNKCNVAELHARVESLVVRIAVADLGARADIRGLATTPSPAATQPAQVAEQDSGMPTWAWWAIGGVAAVGIAAAASGGAGSGGGDSPTGSVGVNW